jgi:small-conductance mechanosensitive channel
MMIRDEQHYKVTLARVTRFRAALARVESAPSTGADPQLQQAGIDAMRAQLEALERELHEFETRHERTP